MTYEIEYSAAAAKAIRRLPGNVQRRVVGKVEALAQNPRPHGAEKLAGHEAYRLRVGDYRIIYAIADERLVVVIVDVGHRREI